MPMALISRMSHNTGPPLDNITGNENMPFFIRLGTPSSKAKVVRDYSQLNSTPNTTILSLLMTLTGCL
jgi:hypothetical protein